MFYDKDAERRLIASLLAYPDELSSLKSDLFTGEERDLFVAMQQCYAAYGEVTREGIALFLKKEPPVFIELPSFRHPKSIVDYLDNLKKKRALAHIQHRIDELLKKQVVSLEDINGALNFDYYVSSATSLDDGIIEFSAELRQKLNGAYEFISTGLPFLDYMLGGEWAKRGLTVILGEGGSGKTALIADSILRMAMRGAPTLFISLEMVKSRLVQRFVANYASIDGLKIKRGDLNEDEVRKVNETLAVLQKLPIFINDDPSVTIEEIASLVRNHRQQHNIRAFFVDYLQIIGGMHPTENASDLYGYFATTLRNVAVECDIAAVLLAQQNRTLSGLHSIFGSGRVGHVADVVFELTATAKNADIRPVEIIIHKNRDGPLGSYTVAYEAPYLRFSGGEHVVARSA